MTSSRSKVHRSKVHSGGFTMVELLITMLLLAIVMTGLAGLQVHTIRQTTAARWAGEATRLAQDAMEKRLAGPVPAPAGWSYESNRFGLMSGVAADGSPPGPFHVHSLIEISGTNTLITVRVTYRDVDARAAATPRQVYLTTMRTP